MNGELFGDSFVLNLEKKLTEGTDWESGPLSCVYNLPTWTDYLNKKDFTSIQNTISRNVGAIRVVEDTHIHTHTNPLERRRHRDCRGLNFLEPENKYLD